MRQIIRQRRDLLQHHPPRQTALQRVGFVLRKIDPGILPQHKENLVIIFHRFQRRLVFRRWRRGALPARDWRVPRDAQNFPGDLRDRQQRIHTARHRRALRHLEKLRAGLRLGESEAARRLDRAEPQRSIRAGAGQNHADGARTGIPRQRAEKSIDRQMQSFRPEPRRQFKDPPPDRHIRIRRDHMQMIRLQSLSLDDLHHLHRRDLPEQLHQLTLVRGIEMLHQHKGQPRIIRQMLQQRRDRPEPSRRSSQSHHREGARRAPPCRAPRPKQRSRFARSHLASSLVPLTRTSRKSSSRLPKVHSRTRKNATALTVNASRIGIAPSAFRTARLTRGNGRATSQTLH